MPPMMYLSILPPNSEFDTDEGFDTEGFEIDDYDSDYVDFLINHFSEIEM